MANAGLTWQKGSETRAGRWRKKFRGKTYYFSAGTGKSDREAYKKAVNDWKNLQLKLAGEPRFVPPAEYVEAIAEWMAVRDRAIHHGNDELQLQAQKKVDELQRRLQCKKIVPLEAEDRFLTRFAISLVELDDKAIAASPVPPVSSVTRYVNPTSEDALRHFAPLNGTAARIAEEIWKDRIQSQQELSSDGPEAVGSHVKKFIEGKRAEVASNQVSAGRCANISLHLQPFEQFLTSTKAVNEIGEDTLAAYRLELLRKVGLNEFSVAYAKDRLDVAKMFVRWCWRQRALKDLPRNIDSKELTITVPVQKQVPCTKAELKCLLKGVSDRMRLYILLALNCGMTQVDISDLLKTEVDWRKGTITRKRSKTRDHENVPEVTYVLWKETIQLLRKFKAEKGERALLNESGGPLKISALHEDGRLHKVDNIQRAFFRLCQEKKITGRSFTSLKKMSATLIRNHKDFASLEDLFLGHAPRSLSDRNYTAAPQELLAKALAWLGKQYGIK